VAFFVGKKAKFSETEEKLSSYLNEVALWCHIKCAVDDTRNWLEKTGIQGFNTN
jgi:hypothetical protein